MNDTMYLNISIKDGLSPVPYMMDDVKM